MAIVHSYQTGEGLAVLPSLLTWALFLVSLVAFLILLEAVAVGYVKNRRARTQGE